MPHQFSTPRRQLTAAVARHLNANAAWLPVLSMAIGLGLPPGSKATVVTEPGSASRGDTQPLAAITELLLIDPRVDRYTELLARRRPGVVGIVVQPHEDGLAALERAVLAHPEATAIHVVAHGEPGLIRLGASDITEARLNTRVGALHQWRQGAGHAGRPDLLIYSCRVAAGAAGAEFVRQLAAWTGMDVAASDDLTGAGGDWELEAATGWIAASRAWSAATLAAYPGTLATFTVTNLNDGGGGSLRDAIASANGALGPDVIEFQPGLMGTITLTGGVLSINDDLTVQGPGAAAITVTGNGASRVFRVGAATNTTLAGLTVADALADGMSDSGRGGGIISYADSLTIQDSVITGNFSASDGGGVFQDLTAGQTLTVQNTMITGNSAGGVGGGLFGAMDDFSSQLSLVSSQITGNNASGNGGGVGIEITNYAGNISIQDSTFDGNFASYDGGGLWVHGYYIAAGDVALGGELTISNTTFSSNEAGYAGGGLFLYGERDFLPVTVDGGTSITGNAAYYEGGGLLFRNDDGAASLTIRNATISANSVVYLGAGLAITFGSYGSEVLIENSQITGNTAADGVGGGLVLTDQAPTPGVPLGSFTLRDTEISGNSAGLFGGGVAIGGPLVDTPLLIERSRITSNQQTGGGMGVKGPGFLPGGGGIGVFSGGFTSLAIVDSTIDGNSATFLGGGLAVAAFPLFSPERAKGPGAYGVGTVDIRGTTISSNTAYVGAGGFIVGPLYGADSRQIVNSTISGNSAEYGGGLLLDLGSLLLRGPKGTGTYDFRVAHTTIAQNTATYYGGGLAAYGSVTTDHTIIATNVASGGDPDVSGDVSASYTLIGDAGGATITDNGGNQIGTTLAPIDPVLGPLANNGGLTQTHELLAGSPAIDSGDPAVSAAPPFDQRGDGFARIVGTVDLGSFEVQRTLALSLSGSPFSENGGQATVTGTLSGTTNVDITATLIFSGTATNGLDYTRSAEQITIPANTSSASITLDGIDDPNDEPDETIVVDVDAVSGGVAEDGVQQVTATVTDDDAPPDVTLSLTGSPFAENGGTADVTATLSAASAFDVTVDLAYSGTAANGTDYSPSASQVVIPAGATSGSITLTGIDDVQFEGDETVVAEITNVINGQEAGGDQSVTAIIAEDDPPPSVSLSLAGSPFAENGGVATVTATLDTAAALDVTVDLALSGTATSGTDYSAAVTQIVIPAGSTSGSIDLTGIDDLDVEGDESVVVDIAGVTNGTEAGIQQVTATIADDDSPPSVTLSLAGSPFAEPAGVATATATLSGPATVDVTVDLAFSGTAGNAIDYSASSSQIVIPAGMTTGSIDLTGIDDALVEGDETVIVDIDAVTNGTESGTQQVTGIIADDDMPSVTLSLSGSPFAENGGVATVSAALSMAAFMDVTIDLGFTGTATNGVDYVPSGVQILIPAGTTSGSITLTGSDDALVEPDESVIVDIITVSNAQESGTQQVSATILDDDLAQATITISALSILESGGSADVCITLSEAVDEDVTIDFSVGGTAASGQDYSISGLQLVIPAGETSGCLTITPIPDEQPEGNETVIVTIDNITNATGTGSVTLGLLDDDAIPVPFLAPWALALLSLLFPGLAARRLRKRRWEARLE